MARMTEAEVREWVLAAEDDDEISEDMLEEAFAAVYGRPPDDHDWAAGLWSLIVSGVDGGR